MNQVHGAHQVGGGLVGDGFGVTVGAGAFDVVGGVVGVMGAVEGWALVDVPPDGEGTGATLDGAPVAPEPEAELGAEPGAELGAGPLDDMVAVGPEAPEDIAGDVAEPAEVCDLATVLGPDVPGEQPFGRSGVLAADTLDPLGIPATTASATGTASAVAVPAFLNEVTTAGPPIRREFQYAP